MVITNYSKYSVKKDKVDLIYSLKALDKKIVKDMMEEKGAESLKELKEYIIDDFEFCLSMSKDDIFTKMYFQKPINNENSMVMSAYNDDIEALWVFVYENNDHYSYYIASEIKEIIKRKLDVE